MAMVPEEEYERLVELAEEAADVEAFRASERRLAAGESEMVPWSVAMRLHEGENPVRVWREHRGLAVQALADRAAISRASLSQIELGKRDGTFKVMTAIARALDLDWDDLAPVNRSPSE